MSETGLRLVVSRVIAASPERVFAAWTSARQLRQWWGPVGVDCLHAEVDARVGGKYRIDNQLPDGSVVVIRGEFEVVLPPRQLTFTWRLSPGPEQCERVSIELRPSGEGTEVVVVHERIADDDRRRSHAAGWEGCLDGLASHCAAVDA